MSEDWKGTLIFVAMFFILIISLVWLVKDSC